MPPSAASTFDPIILSIPVSNHEAATLELEIHGEDRLFVVGPNGSGKSALIQHFVSSITDHPTRRISAHRQTWLNSSVIEMTPKSRRDADRGFVNHERRPDARWKDEQAAQRLSAVLFDLVAGENQRAREIANLVDQDKVEEARSIAGELASPFKRINELLLAGSLSVRIEAATGEEILAHHGEGEPFSMAKLSDGERNAIVLAATVLTVEPGTVLLIDEPERHLHRSIIEPFLTALFASRGDCPFIVSTHELSLPMAASKSRVLLPRSCHWQGDVPQTWEIDVLDAGSDLPDDLKVSVLGSRKRILFVEGELGSLDAPLYGLLFPDTTVISKGSCTHVMRAVEGIRAAEDLHWLQAYGLVDRDSRSDDQVRELQELGVFALSVHSAEAIYYSDAAMRRLARRQAETHGGTAEELLSTATEAALAMLSDEKTMLRLCARRCEGLVRSKIFSQIPSWRDLLSGADISISVSVEELSNKEVATYRAMIEERAVEGLISRYPVRESGALKSIATNLEFKGQLQYENAVLTLASTDGDFREELRVLISPLAAEINPGALAVATSPGGRISQAV